MVMITLAGIRNEHWRRQLGGGQAVSPKYARLYITRGVQHHPRGAEALRKLLTCPPQIDPAVNPWGDCDLLKVVLDGETFYLKADCFARSWNPCEASEDPANDERTTRVYTCMLASEY
ncbi:DUF3768 domain-containing protein [Geothrix fermentans]|uniref:DUF3768 domain-containing protein n=1 Tax=Geothrix fermentans TaxID=44676 RepID=UPI0005BD39AD|nr:DUF3768 domain-containing protein [Geothrix fermentans]